ncbi:MAG: excinuclease ABC subunit UvrB [Anaerolineae bacterium]|nr:excinuclease ABC subunit UvrB [Anaerolineae bacterium]
MKSGRVLPIGELIDTLINRHCTELQYQDDTTILEIEQGETRYFTQAFDPSTGTVALYPVRSFIRHETPEHMYRLQTKCGRTVTLTGDHNLWILREGKLQLTRTTDAQPGDYIPLPETLLASGNAEFIDTLGILDGKRLFVDAQQTLVAYMNEHGTDKVEAVLAESGISPYRKITSIRQGRNGRGIQVNTFRKLLDRTDSFAGAWDGSLSTVGAVGINNRLAAEMALTPDLLRFIGYYIAEGNHQRGYIILANRNEGIRSDIEQTLNRLGLAYGVRQSSDYQVSSTALSHLLSKLCGNKARDKHLPQFWPQLSDYDLGQMLRAYFDGDGTVGKASDIIATTASWQLASDLAYALLRFGIWARISRRWKRATNTDHQGDWYFYVTISGQSNLKRFSENIGFSVAHKCQALLRQLDLPENSNVDIVPIDGTQLRWLRTQLNLFARQVGALSGLSRAAIQLIETGQRAPQRTSLKNILKGLLEEAQQQGKAKGEWLEVWEGLNRLCQLRWTRITSLEETAYSHPHVYDFCVPGVENFLAGHGGLFVHNTFAVAQIVERTQKPTLVLAHNKTLAAQLYAEFKEFFPKNSVEYFVSYYDYYQPEAYVPRLDLHIEKETEINEQIDRLRLAATAALFSRRDVLIVASVSCIYGIGSPQAWGRSILELQVGTSIRRDTILRKLVQIQYTRNDMELRRGTFRARGDTLEVMPAYAETAYRIYLFGDEVERIAEFDTLTGEMLDEHKEIKIFPAKQFVADDDKVRQALHDIEIELDQTVMDFRREGKLVEAQRIEQRTRYDLEMIREVGYCSGIENYSRHLDQRPAGSPPSTLIDYFPSDYLMIIDESHMTIPQVRGMFNGDRQRKSTLIEYGFRLPSALDNRPLSFEEFQQRVNQVVYTSATPGPYEREISEQTVQQVIRPTGILDPEVQVRPIEGQIDDLLQEVALRVKNGQRVLVTTLTQRMAEELAGYINELGIKAHHLHAEIETIERIEILRDLRLGVYDVLVGINLLREGIDLPEVSLVAILDADKEGFLRSEQALIQIIGRAARHVDGKVIMYANVMTDSMKRAIDETNRRRAIQETYNTERGITPRSIIKQVRDLTDRVRSMASEEAQAGTEVDISSLNKEELNRMIKELEKEMRAAAQQLEFEKAAALRDQISELRGTLIDRQVEGNLLN